MTTTFAETKTSEREGQWQKVDQNLSLRRVQNPKGSIRDGVAGVDASAMFQSELSPESFPDGGFDAYMDLVGAFFGLIADFGIPNGMGAIEAYVSRNQLGDYKPSTVSWIFSLHLSTMYFGRIFFGKLLGARKLLILGTFFMFAGLISTAESKELYQFILSFGILTALGTSLAMVPLIGVMSHWFLRKTAMACSTATVGGLIGSYVFVIMLQSLYKSLGYRWAIRILAFICLACMLVAIVVVKERKPEKVSVEVVAEVPENASEAFLKDNLKKSKANFGIPHTRNITDPIIETTSAVAPTIEVPHTERGKGPINWGSTLSKSFSNLAPLREIRFMLLTIAVFLAELNSMTILTYLASFALTGGVSESKSFLLLTIVNVSGIPARLVTGHLADKYGRFKVIIVTSTFSMIFVWALLTPSNGRLSYLKGVFSSHVWVHGSGPDGVM